MSFPANKFDHLIIFLIIVLGTTSLYPQKKVLTRNLERKILYGLEETFKFNFNISEKTFDAIIREFPDNPAGYHFKSIQYLWRYLDNKNPSDYNIFISLSEKVVETDNDSLTQEVNDPFILYIIGSSYSFRAMAYTRDEDYLNAVWAAKKSYSYLTNAVLTDSTFSDAYLGLGLYNFMIAQTPPALRWAMRISGIAGNKMKGIEYLEIAANKGKFSRTEAQYYLSQILSEFYDENKPAEKTLIQLNYNYPRNILFNYSLALLYTKLAEFKKAERILNKIVTSKDTSFKQLKRFSGLSIGNLYFYRNDFKTAKTYYESFIENVSEDFYQGIAAFRLGLCYTFLGDSLIAAQYFKMSDRGNTDIDDDRYAKYFGDEYSENPPDSVRLQIIIAKNLIESAKYKNAEKILLAFNKSNIPGPVIAEINLYLSKISFYLNDFTSSYSYALSVIQNESAAKWIKAFGYYYAARSSFRLKYFTDAVSYLDKVKQFSDFFYENKLGNLINALDFKMHKSLVEQR